MNVYNFYYLRESIPGDLNIIASGFDAAVTKFKQKTTSYRVVEICAVKIVVTKLDLNEAFEL